MLIEALWEDAPPARPDDQLAVLVSRLRAVVGRDRIERGDGGYRLRCDWLDAVELAALTDEADRRRQAGNAAGAAAAARVALSLLRGYGPPPLPGGWAALKLAELDRLTARARQVAAAALLEAGDWMAAADAAQAALDRDGYDEAALRILLRACVAGGRPARRWPPTVLPASGWPRSWAPIPRRRPPPCTRPSCTASWPRRRRLPPGWPEPPWPGPGQPGGTAWSDGTPSWPTWTPRPPGPGAGARKS